MVRSRTRCSEHDVRAHARRSDATISRSLTQDPDPGPSERIVRWDVPDCGARGTRSAEVLDDPKAAVRRLVHAACDRRVLRARHVVVVTAARAFVPHLLQAARKRAAKVAAPAGALVLRELVAGAECTVRGARGSVVLRLCVEARLRRWNAIERRPADARAVLVDALHAEIPDLLERWIHALRLGLGSITRLRVARLGVRGRRAGRWRGGSARVAAG